SRIPERLTFGLASGQRRDTRIHRSSLYSSTTKNRVFSLAETSGIHARPDFCSGIPTPNKHSILPSILKKWATLTLLASRSRFRRLSTDLSLSRYGATAHWISSFRTTLRRSAPPLEGLRCSAAAPRQFG